MRKLFKLKLQAFIIVLRRLRYYYFFKKSDIILLSNIVCRFKPKFIEIGSKFTIFQNVILEFNNSASITIGNGCVLSYGVILALKGNYKMGNFVMVGEYSSIRDYSHDYAEIHTSMSASNDLVEDITIGNNVWIGRGCIIMSGTNIEDGVVIGANSVVKGHLKENGIYAGNPARFIKSRI